MEKPPFNCPICRTYFPSQEKFHHHIRFIHKQKLESFYVSQFPRFDTYDLKPIKYKDPSQYLSSIFNTRSNLVKYCKKFPDKAAAAITECIRTRSELKGLTRMLSTVEARSCVYPTPLLTDSLGLKWCEDIGKKLNLTCRYNYDANLEYNDIEGLCILVDTREKNELQMPKSIKIVRSALNFGDYSTSSSHFNNLFLERKSISDFCGTLSQGYERFNRELTRAAEFDARIVILVECPLNDIFALPYLPHTKKIKATPDFLLHRMREIMDKFENVQFLFVDGRKVAAEVLVKLLTLKNDVKVLDLQYLWDGKRL